ncbi:MAG TPA: IS3 family transposase [Ignavibacteriaceae bacterium]
MSELRKAVQVNQSCAYFGISRSGYYSSLQSVEKEMLRESVIIELVLNIRKRMPRVGAKKLYYMLKDDIGEIGKIGRDKFIDILRSNELLVERKKSFTRTTDSYHRFYKYKNLLYNNEIETPNACWVSDITYLRTEKGFVYLFLITDYFSRKIVGWSLSDSLSIEGGIEALKMALRQRDKDKPLIHHSDRGIQYCSNEYVKILKKNTIQISMTEENHCYENSKAERVNGILKDEFLLDETFKDYEATHKSVKEAIRTYNELRPHWALKLKTPQEVHIQKAA